jgi:hypothetical protein
MKRDLLAIVIISLLTITACEKESHLEKSQGDQIYFNSFEAQSDIDGWIGGAYNFSNDVPIQGGKRSLSVSGGCIIPHAQYKVGAQNSDYYFILKFWGKNLSNGGGVSLGVDRAGYRGTGIDVTKKEWTYYESQDTVFCPANTNLTLDIIAGGIIGSAILVDMIEIRKFSVNH